MPRSLVVQKTYGKSNVVKKSEEDAWKEASSKAKGIWTNVTVSPFKKTPVKEAKVVKSKDDDPFSFDDSENDFFGFNESPSKGKKTPSKQTKSPNPRLKGKNLPSETKTINVSDLKKDGKKKIKDTFKKGTLAALKAELQSPKKSPTKSLSKSPIKKTKNTTTSPKKGSLAALKEKLLSPKKVTGKQAASKKLSPTKNTSPSKKAVSYTHLTLPTIYSV